MNTPDKMRAVFTENAQSWLKRYMEQRTEYAAISTHPVAAELDGHIVAVTRRILCMHTNLVSPKPESFTRLWRCKHCGASAYQED